MRLVERHARAMQAKLQDGLAAQVAAVNAELPAPADATYVMDVAPDDRIYYDYTPTIGELVDFPSIGIQHGRGGLEDDQGWAATGVYELTVVVWDSAGDTETLTHRIRRQLEAVTAVVLAGRRIGEDDDDGAWSVTAGRDAFYYGPILGSIETPSDSRGAFMTYASVTVEIKGEE